ncbi:hypothetical protein D9M71_802450 [compost metagenome]
MLCDCAWAAPVMAAKTAQVRGSKDTFMERLPQPFGLLCVALRAATGQKPDKRVPSRGLRRARGVVMRGWIGALPVGASLLAITTFAGHTGAG